MPPRKRAGRKPVKARKSKKRTKHGNIVVPVEDSPYSRQEGVERVLAHIEKHGKQLPPDKLEREFPGITFNQGARFELHCTLVFRLRLRQYSHSEIMKALGISTQQMVRIIATIRQNFENSVYDISVQEQLGQSVATYREIQGMLMRIGADKGHKVNSRVDALRNAASCEDKVLRAMMIAGAYKEPVVPPKTLQPTSQKTPLNTLQEVMAKILQGDVSPPAIENGASSDVMLDEFNPARM